jgi:hypothetical protein
MRRCGAARKRLSKSRFSVSLPIAAPVHLLGDTENSPVQRQLNRLSLEYEAHSLSRIRIGPFEWRRVTVEEDLESV